MSNIKVIVQDANNIVCEVTPVPIQQIAISRGVAGRGVADVMAVEIDNALYLEFTFTDGTTEIVGPVGTIQYIGQSPIVVTGSTISLSTVPVTLGGTGQTTANAGFNALAPTQATNAGKYLKTDGTNTAWDLLDISTGDITGTLPVANGGTGATTASGARTNLGTAASAITISAGTGLSGGGDLTANRTLNIANTTVTAAAYGSASKTLTATVNAQGQLTALADTNIAITNTQVSGLGTMSTQSAASVAITGGSITGITDLAIADGGTGQNTAAAAITALTGTQISGQYLRSNGTNALLSAIQAADVPTLNQNTTGTAANVTGTVAIANGGTGQITANAAFNALAPSQTSQSGKFLTTDGSNTSWATNLLGTVTSVGGTGTVNGLTLTGTVTTSGNLTLGGTLSGIANSALTNSAITINGSSVSLGGSTTVTATASNALTIGTGLTGTSYNGSTPVTIAIGNTGVSAGTYGSATSIPSIQVNSQGQITSITTSALNSPAYQGTWNASTNIPALTSSVGTNNNYYIVSTAGTTTLNGISLWSVGDWAIFNSTTSAWEKVLGGSAESFSSIAVTGLTGYMYANGSSNVTAATTIPNAGLTNSSITINGSSVSLGGSVTVTATASAALTIGTGLSGTSYNGSTAVTIANTGVLSVSGGTTGLTPATATTGAITLAGTLAVANGGTGVTTSTGTGSVVLSTSPTLITPALGTPSALVGTNITGTASGLTAGNVTTNANLTGAVTSVGNATSLGSFTSAQLATALTDETGSGASVFATSPTLVTPLLGTPTSGNFSTGTFTWPTFNQNTTGTAANVTGTVAIANGGTGQTTANGAFNALAPSQTTNAGKYLTTDGSNTSWATNPLGTVTSVDVSGGTTGLTTSGGPITTSGTITLAGTLAVANGGTGVMTSTGTGSVVLSTSPTLVTPALGTPSALVGTNITGTAAGLSIGGNAATATNVAYSGLTGTVPTWNQNTTGTAANVTGIVAIANGGTGTATPSLVAGTNVTLSGTWPNQTVNATAGGSGTVTSVAATVPSFLSVTGSPITTSGTLALSYSGTALPVLNGGTGSTTATGTGSVVLATSPTLVTPALGTPASGVVTNLTGTASININGTVGATTRNTGDFTTISGNTVTSTTPVLSFNGTNTIASFGTTTASSYNQLIIQNKSGTANASTNYVLSNDIGTDSTYYGEFGMNSSVFSASTPADFFSINNGVYFSGHDGDITVGSGNGYKHYFAWGTAGQSAHVINATGALGLSTNLGTTPALSGTTGYGTSGQVLTSAGSAAAPTWTTPATGTVTSVTGTAPVVSSGGATPAISMAAATTSVNGYLTSTDWTTFNNKGSGTVTAVSVASSNGFTGTSSGGATPALTLTTSVTGVLKGNGTALSAATAGTDYVAPGTATTFTATQTFNGTSSTFASVLLNAAETTTVSATAATGTINYYVNSQSVLYYTTNASANWTLNVAFSSGTSLNTAMATGQTVTIAFMVTQGSTAYYASAFTIDGTSVTPKWQGGTAPTSGNASGVDIYTYTIVKTGSATYSVFASQTQFK